jgi:hypothetical protein
VVEGLSGESRLERRRRQRREYYQRRADKTAGGRAHRQRWTIPEARVALDGRLSVPQAARQLGRTASAVQHLRQRWRTGTLPRGLVDQVPRPPQRVGAVDD